MGETETGVDPEAAAFADALEDLKRRGSMLLVAGEDQDAVGAACDRLLGRSTDQRRRRLFVVAGGHQDVAGPAPRDTRGHVISYETEARSAVTAGDGPAAATPDRTVVGGLDELHEAVDAEIDLLTDGGGLDPAQLRICLDAVDALVASHEREAVFRFLHVLSATVREHRAMFHTHLPAAFDDPAVQSLVPLFDAVIEVESGPQQRWHLRQSDITTQWLPL